MVEPKSTDEEEKDLGCSMNGIETSEDPTGFSPEVVDISLEEQRAVQQLSASLQERRQEVAVHFRSVYIGTILSSTLQPPVVTMNETCLQFALTINCQSSISCKFLYKDLPLILSHFSPRFSALILFLNEHLKLMVKEKICPAIAKTGPEKRTGTRPSNYNCVAFSLVRRTSNSSGNDEADRQRSNRISARVAAILFHKTKHKCVGEEKAKDIIRRLSVDDQASPRSNGAGSPATRSKGPILTYPKDGPGRISISQEDLKCLVGNAFLNDVIIGFYCRYLCNEVLDEVGRRRNHVFDSILLDKLVTTHNQIADNPGSTEERLCSLKKWTRSAKVEEKHFLFFPANQSFHWFLIVFCFPCLLFQTQDGSALDRYANARPVILILDSMNTYSVAVKDAENCTVYGRIQALMSTFVRCITGNECAPLPTHELRVPKQGNNTDCGLFVLEYLDRFLTDNPLTDFSEPFVDLSNWFNPEQIKCTRQNIFNLIQAKISADD